MTAADILAEVFYGLVGLLFLLTIAVVAASTT